MGQMVGISNFEQDIYTYLMSRVIDECQNITSLITTFISLLPSFFSFCLIKAEKDQNFLKSQFYIKILVSTSKFLFPIKLFLD